MQTKTESSAVDSTIEAIRDLIRRGDFAPGQRLIVPDLMKLLKVSAGPIREAIRRLTGEGLIEVQPNRGAIVRSLSLQELSNVFELRELVEGLLARQAALHVREGRNAEDVRDIMKAMAAAREAGDIAAYTEINQKFHNCIYRMSHNARGTEIAEQLVMPLYQFRYHQSFDAAMMNTSYMDHQQISDAILAADPISAERLMRMHIRNSAMMMLETVPANTGLRIEKRSKRN